MIPLNRRSPGRDDGVAEVGLVPGVEGAVGRDVADGAGEVVGPEELHPVRTTATARPARAGPVSMCTRGTPIRRATPPAARLAKVYQPAGGRAIQSHLAIDSCSTAVGRQPPEADGRVNISSHSPTVVENS
jgi:hypothetical protein